MYAAEGRIDSLNLLLYIDYGLLGLSHVRDHAVGDDEQDEVL